MACALPGTPLKLAITKDHSMLEHEQVASWKLLVAMTQHIPPFVSSTLLPGCSPLSPEVLT